MTVERLQQSFARPRRRPRHPRRDRRRPRRHAVRRGGRGLGQDQVPRRPRRRAVTARDVPMREIAAVTFTEKAAAELRDRIRRALEQTATRPPTRRRRRRAAAAALDELDGAAVSTLHAFAQRLLTEHPIEAGLPPRIEVLDDIASQVAFEERWTRFVDAPARRPGARAHAPARAATPTPTLAVLRTIALACNANWDLVAGAHGPRARPAAARPALALARSTRSPTCARSRPQCARPRRQARSTSCVDARRRGTTSCEHAPDEYEQLRLLTVGAPRRSTCDSGPEGQLAVDVRRADDVRRRDRRACASSATELAARRHRGRRAPAGVGDRAVHPREADERRRDAASSSSTTCSCSPARCCATPSTGGTSGAASARATPASCSTSSRTPTRSSATSPRCSPRATRRARRDRWDEIAVDPGPPVRRRRPEAVDLPLPPRRHRRVPARPRRRSAPRRATSPATSAPPGR